MSLLSKGKILRIFVMGNDPRSLKSVELVNWTGHAFLGRREHLKSLSDIPEFAEPGVYFLLSESANDSSVTDIYIGESDNFYERIKQHAYSKDWWDRFIVFVSKDQNLTKAHVKHLEQKLYHLARKAIGTLKVVNPSEPGGSRLPKSDIAAMEEFLENVVFVLETLGLGYFPSESALARSCGQLDVSKQDTSEFLFYINQPKNITNGTPEKYRSFIEMKDSMYILKKGAFIRKSAKESFQSHNYFPLWEQIVSSSSVEQLLENQHLLVTTQDIGFSSPSAAGAVVRGGATNGRTDWLRVRDDIPLFQCEFLSE